MAGVYVSCCSVCLARVFSEIYLDSANFAVDNLSPQARLLVPFYVILHSPTRCVAHSRSNSPTALEPGKTAAAFRQYTPSADDAGGPVAAIGKAAISDWDVGVREHYRLMRQHQTLAFVEAMTKKWSSFEKARMTVAECFELLKGYVDSSDPDTTLPNLEHMLVRSRILSDCERFRRAAAICGTGSTYMTLHCALACLI